MKKLPVLNKHLILALSENSHRTWKHIADVVNFYLPDNEKLVVGEGQSLYYTDASDTDLGDKTKICDFGITSDRVAGQVQRICTVWTSLPMTNLFTHEEKEILNFNIDVKTINDFDLIETRKLINMIKLYNLLRKMNINLLKSFDNRTIIHNDDIIHKSFKLNRRGQANNTYIITFNNDSSFEKIIERIVIELMPSSFNSYRVRIVLGAALDSCYLHVDKISTVRIFDFLHEITYLSPELCYNRLHSEQPLFKLIGKMINVVSKYGEITPFPITRITNHPDPIFFQEPKYINSNEGE